jgi:DnaK suppressor protein
MSRIAEEAERRLRDRRREMLRLIADVECETWQDGPRPAHPSDRATEREPPAVLHSFEETVQHNLRELDAALGRIASGEFGKCESCGGAIGTQRLRALPEARYCIACAGRPAPLAAQG